MLRGFSCLMTIMYIAYLDEFGHIGPYVSRNHSKHKTHPVFGFAGFYLPAHHVREFEGFFEKLKSKLLAWEIEQSGQHPKQWEKKGSALLTVKNIEKYPEVRRAINRILNQIHKLGGQVVFYGQVKPAGEPKDGDETTRNRYDHALKQMAQRLCWTIDRPLMMILDEIDNAERRLAMSSIASFIYTHQDTKKIIQAPIQGESHLFGTLQCADWICALIGRLTAYYFSSEFREFDWAPKYFGTRLEQVTSPDSKILDPTAVRKNIHMKHMARSIESIVSKS